MGWRQWRGRRRTYALLILQEGTIGLIIQSCSHLQKCKCQRNTVPDKSQTQDYSFRISSNEVEGSWLITIFEHRWGCSAPDRSGSIILGFSWIGNSYSRSRQQSSRGGPLHNCMLCASYTYFWTNRSFSHGPYSGHFPFGLLK